MHKILKYFLKNTTGDIMPIMQYAHTYHYIYIMTSNITTLPPLYRFRLYRTNRSMPGYFTHTN